MIINEYLFQAIKAYGDKEHKDRDNRRKQLGDILGLPKLALSNWTAFLLAVYDGNKRVKKGRRLNESKAIELLNLLGINYIPKKRNVIWYKEKNKTTIKCGIGFYQVDGKLYDSSFRLLKASKILKALPLPAVYI